MASNLNVNLKAFNDQGAIEFCLFKSFYLSSFADIIFFFFFFFFFLSNFNTVRFGRLDLLQGQFQSIFFAK